MVDESSIKILVVDDEEVVLNFFKRLLKDKLYDITAVKSGAEALEQVKLKEFDVMFLDILLKDVNGIELFTEIREVRPALDTIFITGKPNQAHLERLDYQGCFYKPFKIKQVREELDKIKKKKNL